MGPEACPSADELLAFHLGQVSAARIDEVADHLTLCSACERQVQELDRLTDPVLAALRRPRPPCGQEGDTLPNETGEKTGKASPLPQIPGYEMLGLLGRAGMGLVYKARHERLNRLVAIKRLRAVGELEAARFQTEAEAIARLQHPHIVQIYEVGDWQGQPYLALELVESGSLA